MILNLFYIGFVLSLFGAMIGIHAYLTRPPYIVNPQNNQQQNMNLLYLRIGLVIVVSGVIVIWLYFKGFRDIHINQDLFWGLFLFLLFLYTLCWASRNDRVKDVIKGYNWIFFTLLFLAFAGPWILREAKEFQMGPGGIKVVRQDIRAETVAMEKERYLQPEAHIKQIDLKVLRTKILQDVALFRLKAYKLEAGLDFNLIGDPPDDNFTDWDTQRLYSQKRLGWAMDINKKNAQNPQINPSDKEKLKEHLEIWKRIDIYEKFKEFLDSDWNNNTFRRAKDESDKGRTQKTKDIIRDEIIPKWQKQENVDKLTSVPYYYIILYRLYLILGDQERASKTLYNGLFASQDHITNMNINFSLGEFMWKNHGDAINAVKYLKIALKTAGDHLKEVNDDFDQVLTLLKNTNKNVMSKAIDTVEGHKEKYQEDLKKRFKSAQTLFMNQIAYCLAQEGEDVDTAMKYSWAAYLEKQNDPDYIDTYAFVLLKFSNKRETEKDKVKDIRTAINLFEEAEYRAHVSNKNTDVFLLHRKYAQGKLRLLTSR